MIKLKGLLNEGGDKLFIKQNTLWVAHGPNSGITGQIKGNPDEWRGFWTNKKGDANYDFIVNWIVKWASSETPVYKVGKDKKLYKVPLWWGHPNGNDLTIWGGDRKPDLFVWLLVSNAGPGNDSYQLVNIFGSKREAVAFMR